MNWVLTINSLSRKALKRIERKDAKRIVEVFEELVMDPYVGDIRKMEGENDTWRRRVGSYRIKYEIEVSQKAIRILEVKRRTSNTY